MHFRETVRLVAMRVIPVPCLTDNYAYLLVCDETRKVAVVNPSESGPLVRALAAAVPEHDVVAIACTHHHYDHVGGVVELAAHFHVADVFGASHDRGKIPGQTRFLEDGDAFEIGRIHVRVISVPGHTLGAIAYVARDGSPAEVVFTGDTLFRGGCGRLFEGDPPMLHASLARLSALAPETLVYCGHEYTESNLRFAAHVEPSNEAVARALAAARTVRASGAPTVPGTIFEERATNPFLRTASREIRASVGLPEDAAEAVVLGAVRLAKDTFR